MNNNLIKGLGKTALCIPVVITSVYASKAIGDDLYKNVHATMNTDDSREMTKSIAKGAFDLVMVGITYSAYNNLIKGIFKA